MSSTDDQQQQEVVQQSNDDNINNQQEESTVTTNNPSKILQTPIRYDRFSAVARKYNPLVINEVRRAFQDNIRELAETEGHCQIYASVEMVRLTLLQTAASIAFYLFYYGATVKFPENVPVMQYCIIAFMILSSVALFYVFGYLEARNFSTLVLPSSVSEDAKEKENVELIQKFIDLASCDEETERRAISSKFVDEDGKEVIDEVVEEDDENEEEEEDEEDQDEEDEETEQEKKNKRLAKSQEKEKEEEELKSIIFPKKTESKVEIVNKERLEQVYSASSVKTKQSNNKKASSETEDREDLFIPENLGLQFYSEVMLGEPKVTITADLVEFQGALFAPKALKTVTTSFYVEEFFSKQGLFYPPALRVEMRRIFQRLLLSNGGSAEKKNK